jgi:hypothetical protein
MIVHAIQQQLAANSLAAFYPAGLSLCVLACLPHSRTHVDNDYIKCNQTTKTGYATQNRALKRPVPPPEGAPPSSVTRPAIATTVTTTTTMTATTASVSAAALLQQSADVAESERPAKQQRTVGPASS